ncbi:putative ribosome biogenesis GTPase RsgA [Spirochaetia bacterium]|nr:putative ribosome biogenesis GTPase RsgA [Spirochaetia bacterium]
MRALVINGSCNIFTVKRLFENTPSSNSGEYYECRIKGKVLNCKDGDEFYNPIAPGDIVEFERDNACNTNDAKITSLHKRKNSFERLNTKNNKRQVLAANVDLVICVTSIVNPPWRPRFIDRVLLQCEYENIPSLLLINKIDLSTFPLSDELQERLEVFRQIGCDVHYVSTFTKEGIDELQNILRGKVSVLVGQSAVGKSSILNTLFPNANLKTGTLNKKYDRGNHTTVQSKLFENDNFSIIDTPGIRQFIPSGIEKSQVIHYMRDISSYALKCEYGASCTHSNEKGCAVQAALQDGLINDDRFTSYLNIVNTFPKSFL